MDTIESANLGLLRILKKLEQDPEKASELLKELRVYISGRKDQSSKAEEWEHVLLIALTDMITTFHQINQKQNKTIEELRINLNNALGRISKLEEKRGFDHPEKLT